MTRGLKDAEGEIYHGGTEGTEIHLTMPAQKGKHFLTGLPH